MMKDELHPSHVTRISDASSFDEICTLCGATDVAGGGWGNLRFACTAVPTGVNVNQPCVVDHFEECVVCNKTYDKRVLSEVLDHAHLPRDFELALLRETDVAYIVTDGEGREVELLKLQVEYHGYDIFTVPDSLAREKGLKS